MKDTKYERDEYIFLARLYEKAEKPVQTIEFIKKMVELNPMLNREEKKVLTSGYKYMITNNRNSWKLINSLEKKEAKKGNSSNLESIKEIKTRVENEMRSTIDDVQDLIDNFLLPNANKNESRAFYLKMKADYYRYLAEFAVDEEKNEAIQLAYDAYKEAYDIAEKNLSNSNNTRLGLALNFSVFCYEIGNAKQDACMIAKAAFEESMKVLDDLEKSKAKETILIIQILKENLLLWTNELNEDDDGEN